jgi:hypothetical protein
LTHLRQGVLAYHPSKAAEAQALLQELEDHVSQRYPGFLLWSVNDPTDEIMKHFLDLAPERRFEVIPLLLFPGQHFSRNVQKLALELRQQRTDVDVSVASCLLERPGFLDAVFATT